MGGSHAQRDMFSWTLTEAALRGGDRAMANAFVAERLSWKPASPINRAWAVRAGKLNRTGADQACNPRDLQGPAPVIGGLT